MGRIPEDHTFTTMCRCTELDINLVGNNQEKEKLPCNFQSIFKSIPYKFMHEMFSTL